MCVSSFVFQGFWNRRAKSLSCTSSHLPGVFCVGTSHHSNDYSKLLFNTSYKVLERSPCVCVLGAEWHFSGSHISYEWINCWNQGMKLFHFFSVGNIALCVVCSTYLITYMVEIKLSESYHERKWLQACNPVRSHTSFRPLSLTEPGSSGLPTVKQKGSSLDPLNCLWNVFIYSDILL